MNNKTDYLESINEMHSDSARKKIEEPLQQGKLNDIIQRIHTNDASTIPSSRFFPIALVSAERLLSFGFELNTSGIVLLSVDTILKHPRFLDYNFEDWTGIQYLVNVGDWKASKPHHRMIWRYLDEKPWTLVLKESNKGELFMVTYHRVHERAAVKLRRENKGSGGPQPPHSS